MAVVTSGSYELASARLQAAGLTAPVIVVTADAVRRGKPAPDAYLVAAQALGAVSFQTAEAQQPDIQRTDLVKSDISVSGKEVVQVRGEFNPGAVAVNHKHPGEEVAFVL